MKIHFLGTNGWFDNETGETLCVLIDCKEGYLVLDAGNGIRKLDSYIKEEKPIYIFLSHFHIDHISGLHILPKFSFSQGITIFGQPGTKDVLSTFLASPFTASLDLLNKLYPVKVAELKEGGNNIGGLRVETAYLRHADPSFGYAFHIEGKKISFCTDTGQCENLVRLSKDADMLMTECSWKETNKNSKWPHMGPEEGAEAARKAGAKKLVLLHFDASSFGPEDKKKAEEKARAVFGNTTAAHDGLEMSI